MSAAVVAKLAKDLEPGEFWFTSCATDHADEEDPAPCPMVGRRVIDVREEVVLGLRCTLVAFDVDGRRRERVVNEGMVVLASGDPEPPF